MMDMIKNWLSTEKSATPMCTSSERYAINNLRSLYKIFNAAQPIIQTPKEINASLNCLTCDEFIKNVIGKTQHFSVQNLPLKIKFTYAGQLAAQINLYIKKSQQVINLYEQAVQHHQIIIHLGRHGKFTCNQTLVVNNKLFLRFRNKNHTFWLVQHFGFYGLYFPKERAYFSLRAHENKNHQSIDENFHILLYKIFAYIVKWNDIDRIPTFSGILLSYRRPFHYFIDLLRVTNSLMSSSEILQRDMRKFIILSGGCFFTAERFFGSQCESLCIHGDDINTYMISNDTFILKPAKDVNNKLNAFNVEKQFYQKLIDRSDESANKDLAFQEILDSAKEAAPLLWVSVCDEHRSWVENHEAICTIAQYFKEKYPNLGLVIDGLTTPEDLSSETFKLSKAKAEEATFVKIKAQLPGIKLINAIGLKSYQKMTLASHVDFFISCFLTDSLYVAQFHSKPGLGYGPKTANPIKHRNPMTVLLPKNNICDLSRTDDGLKSVNGLRYSIEPDYMASTAFKVFEFYNQLRTHEKNLDQVSQGEGFTLHTNPISNSIVITSKLNHTIKIALGERFYTPADRSNTSAYPVISDGYLFRFEAFSNLSSRLHLCAYTEEEVIFEDSFETGRAKNINFPLGAQTFRLFLELFPNDEVEFFDVHWNTNETVGSVRLGGYLDLSINARSGHGTL